MRRQLPQHSMPLTPQNTFGLGIQVYKIESKLPRINSDKNGRRQLIKQLENPAAKKYQKLDKMNNFSYDKIIEKDEKFIYEAAESMRRKSIMNTRSNTLKRTSAKEVDNKQKQRFNRPPSGKVILKMNESNRKEKETASKPDKCIEAPSKILQQKDKEKTSVIKVFPAFENQQLRKLQDKITQVTLRRKQTKKNLRKQLKTTKDQGQQDKIMRKIQMVDLTDVVSEIVNLNQLAPYKQQNQFEEFGLEQYLQRQKGQYQTSDDDEEYELVYRPMVHVSEELEQENQDEQQVSPKLIKQLQKQQSTKNQQ